MNAIVLKFIIYVRGDNCDHSHRVPRNLPNPLPTFMQREELLEFSVNIPTVCIPEPEESSQHLKSLFKVYIILYYIILHYIILYYIILYYIIYFINQHYRFLFNFYSGLPSNSRCIFLISLIFSLKVRLLLFSHCSFRLL
jgi:hypothetical protein